MGLTLFQLSYLLLWILAVALVVVAIVLLYLLAQLHSQLRLAPPRRVNLVGLKFPAFSAKHPMSGETSDNRVFKGQLHAILAVSPNCGSCFRLINELKACCESDLAQVPILLLCLGSLERCRLAVDGIHSIQVLVLDVKDGEAKDLWLIGFPATVIVNEAGHIVDVSHPSTFRGVVSAIQDARTVGGSVATVPPQNPPTTLQQGAAAG
jgi:hypothetical protein